MYLKIPVVPRERWHCPRNHSCWTLTYILLPSFKYLFHICTGNTRAPYKGPNCQTAVLVTYQKCISVFPDTNDRIKLYTLKKKPSFKWFSSGVTTHGSIQQWVVAVISKRLLSHLLQMLPLILVNGMHVEYFFQLNNTTTQYLQTEKVPVITYLSLISFYVIMWASANHNVSPPHSGPRYNKVMKIANYFMADLWPVLAYFHDIGWLESSSYSQCPRELRYFLLLHS